MLSLTEAKLRELEIKLSRLRALHGALQPCIGRCGAPGADVNRRILEELAAGE